MAGINEKATVRSKFAATVKHPTDRLNLLTPTERKARGLLRSIADCKAAAVRALQAAEAQTKRAEGYAAQAEKLEAELAKLEESEEPDGSA